MLLDHQHGLSASSSNSLLVLWMKMRDCKSVPKKNENAYKTNFFVNLKISYTKFVPTNGPRTTLHTIKE